jgi:tRNA-splicing ligase RtcB|tara:strand:+ start:1571 stop:2971 length:1401 start_codon:yes stop_codon:yes gene_type:complete
MKEKLKQISDYEWVLPKEGKMNVDGLIIGNKAIIDGLQDDTIGQIANVAQMPGVINPVCALSDAHFGYGLPMGSVAAFDAEDGIISAGLCGFDINCGINSIRTNLSVEEVVPKMNELIDALFAAVPCGVGSKGKLRLTDEQLEEVMVKGCKWAVANGYGVKEDLENMEENGCMEGADASKISDLAKKRGKPQLGTLGAGNHFLEIQKVTDIYDEEFASKVGVTKKDQVLIMLHCGSRGFGHQVASDYLKIQEKAVEKYGIKLADRQLACAPANSEEGQDYFKAMKCAVNYSFTNRLVMTQWIRETFEKVFGKTWQEMDMHTIYGLCHNVVKLEEYVIDGEKKKVYVHRKGATRAFPGIPALIAGSMGTASFICKGSEIAMEKTFGSSCHGAGRSMSRNAAIAKFRGDDIKTELASKGIVAKSTSPKVLAEEAPLAYKDVSDVIESVDSSGISPKVVRVEPIGVLKG